MAPNLEDFNKDELEAPEWLNKEFLSNVLRQSEKDKEIVVVESRISPASVKGDHYASVMFRVGVDYKDRSGVKKSKSLIIKMMPQVEGQKMELLKETHIFETEIGMYAKVIPRFEKILKEIGDNTKLGAPCIYHSLSPRKIIIFEDLVPQGYSVLRNRECNMTEVKAVYLKIAKWHAISYKLSLEDPSFFDNLRYGFMSISSFATNDFMTGGITVFIKFLDTVPTLAKYKPYFEKMESTLFENCKTSFNEYRENPQENAYYVLCHGDFHSKNMMFKNNPITDKLEDVMLLDFQMSYIGPIVNDIIYSFFMLLSADQRANHIDELIYYYFSNFLETLQKIGFEGSMPKLVEFREQLRRHRSWEIYLLVTFLPMWYAFREGVDPDSMLEDPEVRRALYDQPKFIDELHTLLPKYLHLGVLDI